MKAQERHHLKENQVAIQTARVMDAMAGQRDRILMIGGGIVLVVVLKFAPNGLWPMFERFLPKPRRNSDLGDAPPLAARDKPQRGDVLLDVQAIRKTFGGLLAVNDISFSIRAGDIAKALSTSWLISRSRSVFTQSVLLSSTGAPQR